MKIATLLTDRQYVRFDCDRENLVFRTRTQPLAVLVLDQHYQNRVRVPFH